MFYLAFHLFINFRYYNMDGGGNLLDRKIQEVERHLDTAMRDRSHQTAHVRRVETQILRWCLENPSLRTQVLRFIDCLPALKNPREIVRHLREYFPERTMRLPLTLRLSLSASRAGWVTGRAVATATRATAAAVARLFIAGGTLEEAFRTMEQLKREGFETTVDLLGETTTSQAQADRYADGYLELIRRWPSTLSSPPHVSLKLSSLAYPFDPVDPEGAWRQVRPRLSAILRASQSAGGFVNVDMEQHHLRDLVLWLTQRILEEDFPEESRVGLVIQAYLKDSEEVTRRLLGWIKARRVPLTLRLVRGAYWDSEVILSRQRGWPCPVYATKPETDACFERLTDLLLENHSHARVAIATHNLRSLARAMAKAQSLDVPQNRWECQMLYGMGVAVQKAVLSLGVPVRIYAPVGELIPGMSYLVRRILENTSHASFVAMSLMSEPPRARI